jgi:hypothetical protein
MKRQLFTILLISLFTIPLAYAEGSYAGIMYGKVDSEEIDTGNLGFVIGSTQDSGFGFEGFYSLTIDEDTISLGSFTADISIDTYGLLAVYKTAGSPYFKGKAGFAVVDVEFDFEGLGSVDDDESGFAYGFAVGAQLGNGSLELSYTVLPEFDDFQGIDVDADVDMLAINYLWNFK